MEREPYSDALYPEDSEIERRQGATDAVHRVEPQPPRERGTAVYGETDMDPNAGDQASAHHAEADEHL